ncbi:MAG: prolyl oligopeptidase family serine peptidase [Firmicutes bacterium]|nr:prolyl oligopeptidase family serine peptidase [Bacillota bacterium]
MSIYYQNIDVTDFGPYVTKVVLAMPRKVSQEEICPEQFSVFVDIVDKMGRPVLLPLDFMHRDQLLPSRGYRPVSQAYPSDLEGNKAPEGDYVALEMPYGPIYKCSSAIASDVTSMNGFNKYVVCNYTITQIGEIGTGDDLLKGLVFDQLAGIRNPKRERFHHAVSSYKKQPLGYGYFVPKMQEGKRPLIVWLHGAGEGGDDIAIAYSGNKVTELTEDWVQKKFGGAFVLAPQCPTMWMDDGSHQYGNSGKSMYTKALKAVIDEFIAQYAGAIDTDRIFIGGDSNGGFMTMRMLMSYPGFFKAAFPICEAMIDTAIKKKDIENLKDVGIWFTHAKNDPVVVPKNYVVPTYERLIAAGAKNVHFTFWNKIVDLHDRFKDENGKPFEYFGHFAWIPMLNDDCKVDYDGKPVILNGKKVTLLDWLAQQ